MCVWIEIDREHVCLGRPRRSRRPRIVIGRLARTLDDLNDASHPITKLHVAGKTDEAKSDLARLKKIKEEREAAQAKRKAEAEGLYHRPPIPCPNTNGPLLHIAKAAEVEAKKKAAMSGKRV